MPEERDVQVHLLPCQAPPGRLAGGLAVVIDVLRATTTIVHALAAGAACVRPCAEVEEARALAGRMRVGRALLGGERGGVATPGSNMSNTPRASPARASQSTTVELTTTNGP